MGIYIHVQHASVVMHYRVFASHYLQNKPSCHIISTHQKEKLVSNGVNMLITRMWVHVESIMNTVQHRQVQNLYALSLKHSPLPSSLSPSTSLPLPHLPPLFPFPLPSPPSLLPFTPVCSVLSPVYSSGAGYT